MTDKENPFMDDEQPFEDDMNDFYEASDEGVENTVQPKQSKKGKFGGKFSGKFSAKMKAPKFIDKIPEKYRTRRTAVIVAFVVLVIVVYFFLSAGNDNNEQMHIAPPIQHASTLPAPQAEAMMPSIAAATTNPETNAHVAHKPVIQKQQVAKPVHTVSEQDQLAAAFANPVKPVKATVAKPASVSGGVSKVALSAALNSLVGKIEAMDENQVRLISGKLNAQAVDFEKQNAALQTKMTDLQAQVADLKKQLTVSQAHITELQGKVHSLIQGYTGSFNANGQATYRAVPEAQPAKPAAKTVNSVVTYTVRAVVPGRAWLSASNGETMTIAVGDKLPGYGDVVDINSMNGTVVTSSGAVIKTAG